MTHAKFEELFFSRYPDAELATAHGKFGNNEKNMKVTVVFHKGGKCYSFYGAYEDVLCKCGINVISKERLSNLVSALERAKEMDGGPDLFFGFTADCSEDIKRLTAEIENYKKNYIIV